jgi:hypothetical protein
MKRIMLLMLSFVVALAIVSCKRESQSPSMTAQSVIGTATLVTASGERALKMGDAVAASDSIVTGDRSIVDILYGEQALLRISENSKLAVQELISDKTDNTKLYMDKGKLHVTLAKMKKGSFTVDTPTMVAAVRGTSFRIVVGDDRTRLDVLKGSVRVNPVVEGKVAEDVSQMVETRQTVEVDQEVAAAAVNDKKEMPIVALQPQEIKAIVEEVKDIPAPVIEKLETDVKREMKEDVLQLPQAVEQQKEPEKDARAQMAEQRRKQQAAAQQQAQAQQRAKQAQDAQAQEQARLAALKKQADEEKARQDQIRAQQEVQRKEKEKRDRASNIPTL